MHSCETVRGRSHHPRFIYLLIYLFGFVEGQQHVSVLPKRIYKANFSYYRNGDYDLGDY